MWKYILKRILWLIVIMLCVAVVIFVILWFVPGDPAQIVLGTGATQADIDRQREIMGLNAPFIVQLGRYLRDVFLHFDLEILMYMEHLLLMNLQQDFQEHLDLD